MPRELAGAVADARDYGFDVEPRPARLAALKTTRDAYVARLNGIYERNLAKSKVELIRGWAARRCARVEVDGAALTRRTRADRNRRHAAPAANSRRGTRHRFRWLLRAGARGPSGSPSWAAATSASSSPACSRRSAARSRWCCAVTTLLRDFDPLLLAGALDALKAGRHGAAECGGASADARVPMARSPPICRTATRPARRRRMSGPPAAGRAPASSRPGRA